MPIIRPITFLPGGGEGERLLPITEKDPKSFLQYAGVYKVMDLHLSNCYHSQNRIIYILAQYISDPIKDHVDKGWSPRIGIGSEQVISTRTANYDLNSREWFKSTADAVFQKIGYVKTHNANVVNILPADHICLMNIAQMNEYHFEKKADLTISAIPVDIELARNRFGVLVINKDWEIVDFQEKPQNPEPIPNPDKNPDLEGKCLASMGIYAFVPAVLEAELLVDAEKISVLRKEEALQMPDKYSTHDFGNDVIPAMLRDRRRIIAYPYHLNRLTEDTPIQKPYWRDIGDIDQYFEANMEARGPVPPIDLRHPKWKIYTYFELTQPAKVIGGNYRDSINSPGVVVSNATVDGCVLSYGVIIHEEAKVINSICSGYNDIGPGAEIVNAIIPRNVKIPPGVRVGVSRNEDLARGFKISPKGITVVPPSHKF